jgi:hypothetical protein
MSVAPVEPEWAADPLSGWPEEVLTGLADASSRVLIFVMSVRCLTHSD